VPTGRFCLAFDDPTLTWSPTWTRIDSNPNLVTSYTIDRGRQYELDRTDVGRAQVSIADVDGILDPTNSSGPYYGKIEPLLQAVISRRNPMDGTWYTRYRGFVEELDYVFDPSQRVNRLVVGLIDIFEVLAAIEMLPGQFGDTPPASSAGQVFFDNANMDVRIIQILGDAGIPTSFYVVFTGNVELWETTYSPAESAMTAIQEAADAEFPGVSNVYTDRLGRLCVHGRLAKFEPGTISAGSGGAWDYNPWQAGDGAAVAGGGIAQIRTFAFNRGLSKVINQATATPLKPLTLTAVEAAGQIVSDTTSIGLRGIRSWSAQNLLTKLGLLDSADALTETKRFATYYVDNYAEPRNRVTDIGFRSMSPDNPHAGIMWEFLSKVDIADSVAVTVGSPGGGGFTAEPYFVEGVHEQVGPLGTDDYDDVTLTLDLSPQAYFTDNPFPTS
jgi:hypothetical protein